MTVPVMLVVADGLPLPPPQPAKARQASKTALGTAVREKRNVMECVSSQGLVPPGWVGSFQFNFLYAPFSKLYVVNEIHNSEKMNKQCKFFLPRT
jgi:hypothetical protein